MFGYYLRDEPGAGEGLRTIKLPGGGTMTMRRGGRGWTPPAELLKKYDKDGDGKLSAEERRAIWEGARERHRQAMLKKYDADGDGKLSDEETAAMKAEQKKAMTERAEAWKTWREKVTKEADADGDGKATPEEWKAYYKKRQEEMLKKYDADGDGKLNAEERAKMTKESGGPARPLPYRIGGAGATPLEVIDDGDGTTVIYGDAGAGTMVIIRRAPVAPAQKDK